MAKYLIEDIIPPERRRSATGDRKVSIRTDVVKSIDHQAHFPDAERLRTRTQKPELHPEDKGYIDENYVDEAPSSEALQNNPRSMIVNLVGGESASSAPLVTMKYFDESVSSLQGGSSAPVSSLSSTPSHVSLPRKSLLRNWTPWLIGILLVMAIGVFAMTYFGGATVVLSPKRESIPMDLSLTALKGPKSGELPFSVMKVTLDDTQEVPATGEKTLTVKAKGQIIIYNTQSSLQRLIKNTRFQSPSGKIYRINDSVNVPGAGVKSGKTVPGSIEATIYADEAGPDYNSVATDFTIPGLKGSPTFDKVYARGKGAVTGGASGTIKSVSDLDLKHAADSLRVSLETKLRSKARGDLAPSQISFGNGLVVELGEAALSKAAASSDDKAVVSLSGTLSMVAFDREALTQALVGKLVQDYNGEEVAIANLDSVDFEMDKMTAKELWDADKIVFSVKGLPKFEWSIDEASIKKALVGTPKANFNSVMSQFTTVTMAKATIAPIWTRSFPKDVTHINVLIEPQSAEK